MRWTELLEQQINISTIVPDDIAGVTELAGKVFADHFPSEHMAAYLRGVVDWNLSRKLTVDGRLVGAYLLGSAQLPESVEGCVIHGDLEAFRGLRGLQGIALLVDPAERGRDYGRMLRSLPSKMDIDYIWGQQLKSIGNLDAWRQHRELIADCGSVWVTAQRF